MQLKCRCGTWTGHEYWSVIDERCRLELAGRLRTRQLTREECGACGRPLLCAEPIAVLHTAQTGTYGLLFSEWSVPDADRPTVPGFDGPWLQLPFGAAPVVLGRDIDTDLADVGAAHAQVTREQGPAAGMSYRESLRYLLVSSDPYRVFNVMAALAGGESARFRALVAQQPDLLTDGFQDAARRMRLAFPEQDALLAATAELFVAARVNSERAWETFTGRIARLVDTFDQVGREIEQLADAREAGDLQRVISDGPVVLEHARSVGASLAGAYAGEILAGALLHSTAGDRASQMEEAIAVISDAVEHSTEDVERASRTMQLAMVFMERAGGDRARNVEEAVLLLRDARRLVADDDPRLLAMIQTNLAYVLSLRERGDRAESLTEGYECCQAALTWRTPERDPVDWSYTQVNLGMIIDGLAELGMADRLDARAAWQSVLPYAVSLPANLLATAQANIARLDRLDAAQAATGGEDSGELALARERLARQIAVLADAGPVAYGRALRELAGIDLQLGDRVRAIDGYARALRELRPERSPRESQTLATRLAELHAEDDRWPQAAVAYRDAVTASNLRYYGRGSATDREIQTRDAGNLSRWASFAIAKAGDARRALLTLEDGRTRELRRRVGAEDQQLAELASAAPELHREYERSLADLARADLIDDADTAAAEHQRVLERVRSLAGMAHFGGPVSWSTLLAAAEPGTPLVYLNPTPAGTALMTLAHDGTLRTRILELTSTDVVQGLMFSVQDGRKLPPPSYLAAAVGTGEGIDTALASALPWVGKLLAEPIAQELRAVNASAGVVVLCGLISQFPVHFAPWRSAGGESTLAGEFDITFEPSATMRVVSAGRARERARPAGKQVLVAVGDPDAGGGPLPAARAEVTEIARAFGAARAHAATGDEATSTFLRTRARAGDYLHLACHASGAMPAFRESALQLADGELALSELGRIGPLRCRLAVASACQTAMPDADLGDEALSIAAVLLAAGSAGAIASLWPVNDLATAILMIRLYEELLHASEPTPAQALREAQLWLRGLSRTDVEAFMDTHPALALEAAERRRRDESILPEGDLPFARPGYWAAFLSMGA